MSFNLFFYKGLRFPRSILSLLAAICLTACDGGSSTNTAYEPGTPVAYCADTPAVEPRAGHPVYEIADADLIGATLTPSVACTVAAHYAAGYVILASQDIDPWNDLDQRIVIESSPEAEANPPPADQDHALHHTLINPPVFTESKLGYRESFLFARHPQGNGEPWECEVISNKLDMENDSQAHQEQVKQCLAELQNLTSENSAASASQSLAPQPHSPSATRGFSADNHTFASDSAVLGEMAVLAAANSAPPNQQGDSIPDTEHWTTLGTTTKTFQHSEAHTIFGIVDPSTQPHRGNIKVMFDLYRLNSLDAHDYFLVKARWSATPNFYTSQCRAIQHCAHFNNSHRLGFSLGRQHAGKVAEPGLLTSYSPQNVVRQQTYQAKIGGGLKVSKSSGEATLSGEVSTAYTYRAADILATEGVSNSVTFDISHATSVLRWPPFVGIYLYDNDSTTLRTMAPTVWALYKFPRHPDDNKADSSMVLTVNEMSGTFGQATAAGTFLSPVPIVSVSKYQVKERGRSHAFTARFSLPHFSVKIRNEQGAYVAAPTTTANTLALKRGQTLSLLVDAGGMSDANGKPSGGRPIVLNWQLLELPSSFIASDTRGNGQSRIEIIIDSKAPVGERGFLKFNTSPRAAAPNLQSGNLSVPYVIVE